MTLAELWELFPITIAAHNPHWKLWADEEIGNLSKILSDYPARISHIGSTAIPNIQANPIIDILVEVSNKYDNRDGYTAAKSQFIRRILSMSRNI